MKQEKRSLCGLRVRHWSEVRLFFIGHRRDDGIRGGLRLLFLICQLVNGDYISVMREGHLVVDRRRDKKHRICVAMTQ